MSIYVPNGFGAGNDNSVNGGGGGFMAIPQVPTPLGFNPPNVSGSYDQGNSWNIQEGPVQATIVAAGTWSIINNPGRNTSTP